MKKTIFTCSLFLTAFFVVLSCNVPKGDDQTESAAVTAHMTPLAEVQRNIQHYVDSCNTFFNDSITIKGTPNPASAIIRAYTISDTDLLSVLGLPLSQVEDCIYN